MVIVGRVEVVTYQKVR